MNQENVSYDSVIEKFKELLKSGSGKYGDWKEVTDMAALLFPEERKKFNKKTWDLLCTASSYDTGGKK